MKKALSLVISLGILALIYWKLSQHGQLAQLGRIFANCDQLWMTLSLRSARGDHQFQSSSNEHERLSRFTLVAYAAMLLISAFLLKPFGVIGFMFVWLAAEVAQTIYILRLNVQLFPREVKISMAPVVRLVGVLAVAFGIAAWPAFASIHWPLGTVVGVAVTITLLMSLASYYFFGLDEVRSVLQSKIRRRLVPTG